MMLRRSLGAATFAGLILAAACGGSSDEGGGGGGPVALADIPGEVAKLQCDLYEKCFGSLFSLFLGGEDCETLTKSQVDNGEISQAQASVDAGKITYDPALAATCLSDLAGRSCDQLLQRTSDACDKAFGNGAALGEQCSYDFECDGKAYCNHSAACPGTCTALEPAGGSCSEDDDCQDGLLCDAGACVAPAGVGQACGGGSAPPCAPSALCLGEDTGQPGTCKAAAEVFAAKAGDNCDWDSGTLCSAELVCAYETLSGGGKCVARVGSGAACKRVSIPSQCPATEFCDGTGTSPDGTCKALPGAGAPCAKVLGDDACAPYTRCDNGTCVALKPNGQSCSNPSVCYSETCVNNVCKINSCS